MFRFCSSGASDEFTLSDSHHNNHNHTVIAPIAATTIPIGPAIAPSTGTSKATHHHKAVIAVPAIVVASHKLNMKSRKEFRGHATTLKAFTSHSPRSAIKLRSLLFSMVSWLSVVPNLCAASFVSAVFSANAWFASHNASLNTVPPFATASREFLSLISLPIRFSIV